MELKRRFYPKTRGRTFRVRQLYYRDKEGREHRDRYDVVVGAHSIDSADGSIRLMFDATDSDEVVIVINRLIADLEKLKKQAEKGFF